MATIETLNYISQQLNVYGGLFMFIFGVIGAVWNILIFRHHSLRSSSYCTYMLVGSIASLFQLLFSLTDRIIDAGFGIHWTAYNIVWCKIRYYIAHWASLTALSCLVFSAVDRFFSTCRQIKWRHLNSVHVARQFCLLITLFWMIITIPTLIYVTPIQLTANRRLCVNSSLIWSNIVTFFFSLCCYGIFSWFFMSLFGFLAWKKIRRMRTRRIGIASLGLLSRAARIDDQLASMLFLQIIICVISSIPFCTQSIYYSFTQTLSKSSYRKAQEYLFLQIARLTFYCNYMSMFYVNCLSSTIFRQLSKEVVLNLFRKQENISQEITIVNHQENNNHLKKQKFQICIIQPVSSISRI